MRHLTYKPAMAMIFCLMAGNALAAEPIKPLVLKAKYTIAWSGISLGRIRIDANETASIYRMTIDTKTRGIGALVSDEARVVTAEGTVNAAGEYVPVRYRSGPHKDGEDAVTTITYDATGNIVTRERVPADTDPNYRPVVPLNEASAARDPVTAAFILRRKLYETMGTGTSEVMTRTYDGRRLATMRLVQATDARVPIMEDYIESISAGVKREPISGYTAKELKKYKKGDPDIRLYFSKDAAFLPIRATAKTALGELSMTLSEKY